MTVIKFSPLHQAYENQCVKKAIGVKKNDEFFVIFIWLRALKVIIYIGG